MAKQFFVMCIQNNTFTHIAQGLQKMCNYFKIQGTTRHNRTCTEWNCMHIDFLSLHLKMKYYYFNLFHVCVFKDNSVI